MVNTVLWFMYHRMKLMTMEDLVKVVADFYHDDEKLIEEAKQILYDNIPERLRPQSLRRNIRRQGNSKDKAMANAGDIYALLQAMQTDSTLSTFKFATVSCQFPSMEIGSIDAVSLYTDVLSLKTEMKMMKVQNEETKKDVDILKNGRLEILSKVDEITKDNHGFVLATDDFSQTIENLKENIAAIQEALKVNDGFISNAGSSAKINNTGKQKSVELTSMPTFADKIQQSLNSASQSLSNNVATQPPYDQKNYDNDLPFRTVTKRRKQAPKIGKKLESAIKTVKPLPKLFEIFVTRFDPSTSADELTKFVKTQFENASAVACTQLVTKYQSYASFKVAIRGIPIKECLNVERWPEGVLVKKFFSSPERKNSDKATSSAQNSNSI